MDETKNGKTHTANPLKIFYFCHTKIKNFILLLEQKHFINHFINISHDMMIHKRAEGGG